MDTVLKTYCLRMAVVKTLKHRFPPKLSQHEWLGVFRRSYEQRRHHDGFDSRLCVGAAVSCLLLSPPAKPAAILSCVAMGLGRLLAAPRARRFPVVGGRVFRQRAFSGRDGAVHLCFTRLMRASYRFRWYDAVVGTFGVALALLTLRGHLVNGVFRPDAQPMIRLGVGLAVILLYCSAVFYVNSQRRGSLAFQVLAISLALWAVLLAVGQLQSPMGEPFGSANRLFGPVPQMLLGIAMVMVLFENQRNAVQENTLALSTLGVDPRRLLFAEDLVPNMRAALERLRSALP